VHDAVGCVRVQPHEARSSGHESTGPSGRNLVRRGDADSGRDVSRLPADDEDEVRVNVERDLLAVLAGDAVDVLADVKHARPGQGSRVRDRNAFRPERPRQRRLAASVSSDAKSGGRRERCDARGDTDQRARSPAWPHVVSARPSGR
jgi:hypothetical protein